MKARPSDWITLTNVNPYRKNGVVQIRSGHISSLEENAWEGSRREDDPRLKHLTCLTLVYTVGGSQLQVQETVAEINAKIAELEVQDDD